MRPSPPLRRVRRLDRALTRRVSSLDAPGLVRVLDGLEAAASRTKLWWGGALVLAAGGGARGRRAAAAGLLSMGAAQLLANAVFKQLYARRRPPNELVGRAEPPARPGSSSFPSGHVAAAAAFSGGVALVWPAAGALACVPAALIGVQRVHCGAHYPSDVACGALIGLAAPALLARTPRAAVRPLVRAGARIAAP
ncbi:MULTISPECIES: phosphatase PAP2 family protein [Streptomyces]|uniref:phosphatase PAP2 family protein n=1 Tax=Streptomyces TaxID=1883 RepID=UPI002248D61A|nr:phosphatase PAP2 family protein [Streptomyces sp. JHD 1]MCX2969000.1 phosphatase PAP2 family protein [Streptomyces sp. JHD 1]